MNMTIMMATKIVALAAYRAAFKATKEQLRKMGFSKKDQKAIARKAAGAAHVVAYEETARSLKRMMR